MPYEGWNPRFLAYAKAHNMTLEEILEMDRCRFPGGSMAGFMTWLSEHWREFDDEHNYRKDVIRDDEMHLAFDKWLLDRVQSQSLPLCVHVPDDVVGEAAGRDNP